MEYPIENPRGKVLGKKVLYSQDCMKIALECGELFRVEGDRRGQVIQVLEGRIWLTQTGNRKDVILEQGQAYRIDGPELVLLEGLPSARFHFIAQ